MKNVKFATHYEGCVSAEKRNVLRQRLLSLNILDRYYFDYRITILFPNHIESACKLHIISGPHKDNKTFTADIVTSGIQTNTSFGDV